MIDTVTLRLNESQFRILDHNKFSPNTYNFFHQPYARMGNRGYIDAYQNPTRTELKEGIYKPQLTLRKRWQNTEALTYLYIQFSAPKILFGNNFDELVDTDLDKVLSELGSRLLEMGVGLRITDLSEAQVSKIHYSRNIVLPEYIIPFLIISEVKKIDFNLHQELTERDYRNSGHSIRFHTNGFELILYDKMKDFQKSMKSDKRSIEKDYTNQLSLFETLKKKPFDVLRIEARLNNANRIKSELGISKKNQTLKTLFNSNLSCKLLSKKWKAILEKYQLLRCDIDDKEKFLASFLINNPKATLTKALSTYGLIVFIKHMGIGKFRNFVENRYSARSWYSLKAKTNNFKIDQKLPNQLEAITKALNSYEPLHLENYKDSI